MKKFRDVKKKKKTGKFPRISEISRKIFTTLFNPFLVDVPFLYPLKTSEKSNNADVFRGYRNGTLA